MLNKGSFVIVDGIAGCGKTTILKATKNWFQESGARIFDLTVWSENNTRPPSFAETNHADVLFTFEPTRTWIGSAIREELSKPEEEYSALSLAHAFSLDREVMYKRLILPALKAGKIIIQDRGVTTSIVYQPVMDGSITLEEITSLPGNRLALLNPPNHLILPQISAEDAFLRGQKRAESKGVFSEVLSDLEKWNDRFNSLWFHDLFTKKGTQIHTIQTDVPLADTLTQAKKLFQTLFNL